MFYFQSKETQTTVIRTGEEQEELVPMRGAARGTDGWIGACARAPLICQRRGFSRRAGERIKASLFITRARATTHTHTHTCVQPLCTRQRTWVCFLSALVHFSVSEAGSCVKVSKITKPHVESIRFVLIVQLIIITIVNIFIFNIIFRLFILRLNPKSNPHWWNHGSTVSQNRELVRKS